MTKEEKLKIDKINAKNAKKMKCKIYFNFANFFKKILIKSITLIPLVLYVFHQSINQVK